MIGEMIVFSKRSLLLLALISMVLSAFLLSGCAKSSEKDSLKRVKSAGEMSFAMSGGYPPFNFYNDKNVLNGFDVDVSKEVAKRLGVKFKPVTAEWNGLVPGLTSGTFDAILGSMAITPERQKVVAFSTPYYYSGPQLIVQENSPYKSSADLKGKKIGLATGTTFEGDAKKLGAAIKLYKDDNLTLLELKNGTIDAVITDRGVGLNAIKNGGYKFKLLGELLRNEDIAVAFRQDDVELKAAVNKIILEMHKDGTLKTLSQKWLNTDVTSK
jgi:polar amino acid transport system substrate-binding protein